MFSYRPKPSVYCVSITGNKCELGCRHCRGRYLKGMDATEDPDSLVRAFMRAKEGGARCILISGGFDKRGRLPIVDFLEAIKQGKSSTGLIVETHSGLIEEVEELASVGVDAILIDVVGDQETIENYLGGTWSVRDYGELLRNVKRFIPLVAAHILVGVNGGEIKGEFKAVDMAAEAGVDALSILTLMDAKAPELEDIVKVMDYTRDRFMGHLTLGCMRARGKERCDIERAAVDLGFDGIANPLNGTLRYAESVKAPVVEFEGCCVFTPSKIPRSTKDHWGARLEGREGT